jgi:hypothetical protein
MGPILRDLDPVTTGALFCPEPEERTVLREVCSPDKVHITSRKTVILTWILLTILRSHFYIILKFSSTFKIVYVHIDLTSWYVVSNYYWSFPISSEGKSTKAWSQHLFIIHFMRDTSLPLFLQAECDMFSLQNFSRFSNENNITGILRIIKTFLV